jgi:hypothetical protein
MWVEGGADQKSLELVKSSRLSIRGVSLGVYRNLVSNIFP